MHVELDGLGLFLVFEMVIGQEVVEFIHHWRGGVSPFWEAGYLAAGVGRGKQRGVKASRVTGNTTNPGLFSHIHTTRPPLPSVGPTSAEVPSM